MKPPADDACVWPCVLVKPDGTTANMEPITLPTKQPSLGETILSGEALLEIVGIADGRLYLKTKDRRQTNRRRGSRRSTY